MANTVQALITSSLRMIGQLGPGRGANSAELADALVILNGMVDSWNTDRLNVWQIVTTTYPLDPSNINYITAARPEKIESAYLVNGLTRRKLNPINDDQWKAGAPGIYNDGGFPNATLQISPDPSSGDSLELGVWLQIAEFVALTDLVAFPPGYFDALRYCLAERLAIEWGKPLRPEVTGFARYSKAAIESRNSVTPVMDCDSAVINARLHPTFDWRTGR